MGKATGFQLWFAMVSKSDLRKREWESKSQVAEWRYSQGEKGRGREGERGTEYGKTEGFSPPEAKDVRRGGRRGAATGLMRPISRNICKQHIYLGLKPEFQDAVRPQSPRHRHPIVLKPINTDVQHDQMAVCIPTRDPAPRHVEDQQTNSTT